MSAENKTHRTPSAAHPVEAVNLTLPEEQGAAPHDQEERRARLFWESRRPIESALMRRIEGPFLQALESALRADERTLFVVTGPRKAGMHTFFKQTTADAAQADFSQSSVRLNAEDAPRTFLARYAAAPVLVLGNAHLAPKLTALLAAHAGELHAGHPLAAPKVVVIGSAVKLPALEAAAALNPAVRTFRLRTLVQSEIQGGGGTFIDRLADLDFPAHLSHDECNCDLILEEAMRGGYPAGRDGSPDARHDFFHDLIREICKVDLPAVSTLRDPFLMRKIYRLVGASSGDVFNLSQAAKRLSISRALAARCLQALESLYLVEALPAWPGALAFERGVRSPKRFITDSGWLCGLLGFCSVHPSAIAVEHASVARRLIACWTWAQLAALADNQSVRRLWHFGLRTGLDVEFLLENRATGELTAMIALAKESVSEADLAPLAKFRDLVAEAAAQKRANLPPVRRVQCIALYCGQSVRRFEGLGAAVPLAFLWR